MLDRSEIICDAVPFEPGDPRIENFFRAIELVLPNTRIDHAILSTRYKWERVSDRVQLVNDRAFDIASGKHLTTIFGNGRHDDEMVSVTLGKSSKGRVGSMRKIWTLRVSISNERGSTLSILPDLLSAVCESAVAINGWAGAFSCLSQISAHAKQAIEDMGAEKRDFCEIEASSRLHNDDPEKRPVMGKMPDGFRFEMPLSWVNYWSDSVAQSLDFPSAERDECLNGLYYRVSNCGWIVKLTDEPLDLGNPEHLERFDWASHRFGK